MDKVQKSCTWVKLVCASLLFTFLLKLTYSSIFFLLYSSVKSKNTEFAHSRIFLSMSVCREDVNDPVNDHLFGSNDFIFLFKLAILANSVLKCILSSILFSGYDRHVNLKIFLIYFLYFYKNVAASNEMLSQSHVLLKKQYSCINTEMEYSKLAATCTAERSACFFFHI